MLIPRRAVLAAALALLAGPAAVPAQPTWPVYRDERAGFELRYPPAFVAGAHRNSLPPDLVRKLQETGGRPPFEHALALVEPGRLGTRDRTTLPAGEITAITIEPLLPVEADARRRLGRQIYGTTITEIAIGPHRVQRFPGAPGPTGYDRVIEHIIGTLTVLSPRK